MTTCILHIGMHKTGSSSIQETLHHYQTSPKQYTYASFGSRKGSNHGSAIGMLFSPFQQRFLTPFHRTLPKDKFCRTRDRMKKSFMKSVEESRESRYFILSGEGMNFLKPHALEHLCYFLKEHFSDISVIAYVRDPRSFITSYFQQCLKFSKVQLNIESSYPYYIDRFKKFEHTFGRKNIKYRFFSPPSLKNECVVQDFLAHYEIEIPQEEIVRINESLCFEAICILYMYRKFGPQYLRKFGKNKHCQLDKPNFDLDKGLIKALFTLSGKKLKFHRDLVTPALEKNRTDIEWMEERLGVSLINKVNASSDGVKVEEDLFKFNSSKIRQDLTQSNLCIPHSLQKIPQEALPEKIATWAYGLRMEMAGKTD